MTSAYDDLMYAMGTIALASLTLAIVGTTTNQPALPHNVRSPLVAVISLDDIGKPLSGANSYKLHFTQIPPAHWTLTSLDKDNMPYNNTVWLRSIKKNTDGSLDIYVQHRSPPKDKQSNWLPSPKDSFRLLLRTPVIWGQEPPSLVVQRMIDGHFPAHRPAQMFHVQ
jgi:hypothetical protein